MALVKWIPVIQITAVETRKIATRMKSDMFAAIYQPAKNSRRDEHDDTIHHRRNRHCPIPDHAQGYKDRQRPIVNPDLHPYRDGLLLLQIQQSRQKIPNWKTGHIK